MLKEEPGKLYVLFRQSCYYYYHVVPYSMNILVLGAGDRKVSKDTNLIRIQCGASSNSMFQMSKACGSSEKEAINSAWGGGGRLHGNSDK